MTNNYCVSCGEIILEGRQVCPKCATHTKEMNVYVTLGENPCLHIENSYLITGKNGIRKTLDFIRTTRMYEKLKAAGYSRTPKSEYQEWRAHNFLYRIGYKTDRTGNVDIDQNEPKWRRIIYAILSTFEV